MTTPAVESTQPQPAHTKALTYAFGDSAYGVSFLPWNDNIRLQPAPPNLCDYPHIKGIITLRDQLVPIFDLREQKEMKPAKLSRSKAHSFLLVVSMFHNGAEPMLVGLLVSTLASEFSLPPDLAKNFTRNN